MTGPPSVDFAIRSGRLIGGGDRVEMTVTPGAGGSDSRRPGSVEIVGRAEWLGPRPVPLNTLVGREQDVQSLRALLLDPAHRLVTLTGPGGVGKTRLALAAASSADAAFDVVAFVPLASVRDPDLVLETIARTIGLQSTDEPTPGGFRHLLRSRTMLLVLDNLEHLLDARPGLAVLLGEVPGITMLVTSRTTLRTAGEQVMTVGPLSNPGPGSLPPVNTLHRFGAVQLFVERCRAVRPSFALDETNAAEVVEICRRLDGLPLAIELASARITVLPPAALLRRLCLDLLTTGAADQPARLRTMRWGIAWSYELLSIDEQFLFCRLAVFAGACTLHAVESVFADRESLALDTVSALVDSSLVQQTTLAGEPRFVMLETIREYALECLEASGDEAAARRTHVAYFRDLARAAESALRGPRQQQWRDELEAELNNLRAALSWTLGELAQPTDADSGLMIVGSLWYFWFQRGLTGEARRWLAQALAKAPSRGRDRAQALLGAGTLAWRQGDCDTARGHLDESSVLWRDEGDLRGLAETLHVLGHVRFDQRDYQEARVLFEESLKDYRQADDTIGGLPLLGDLGLVAYHEGDFETADRILNQTLILYREHGLKDRIAGTLNSVGDLARLAGDTERATVSYEESLALWRELRGTPGIASALHKLGQVSCGNGKYRLARRRFTESLLLQEDLGNKQGIAECLAGLAATCAVLGQPVRAAQLFAAGTALLTSIGVPLAPVDQLALTRDIDATRRHLGQDAWDEAWNAGSALSGEQAIRLARIDDAESHSTNATGGQDSEPEISDHRLSRRERQVTQLLAQGLTYREIAGALFISERTVGSHIDHIMTKLGLRSRTRVAVWAVEHGLGGDRTD